MLRLLLVAAAAAFVGAQTLPQQLDETLAAPAAARAFWGVKVVDLGTGTTAYERNANSYFVPASNTKLFSTAAALTRLGPDYRFSTVVASTAPADVEGRVKGDVRIIGGGDPTLTARDFPNHKGKPSGVALRELDQLAGQVAARGVRIVEGDIVGDDTAYPWEPYPKGWSQDDALWEYGAPVSALIINDNSLKLCVRPASQAGEPARLKIVPNTGYYFLLNRVQTVASGDPDILLERSPGSQEIVLRGQIPLTSSGRNLLVAIDDPALFAARAFQDALMRRGITVGGTARAVHRYGGAVPPAPPDDKLVLARRQSPPLEEILRVADKVSQNLYAEVVLREAARVLRGDGSRDLALEEMAAFLAEAGIAKEDYHLEDASGLSRLTLATPSAFTSLLAFMDRSPYREAWLQMLPVGGEDGTLEKRFFPAAGAFRVQAKTGSLSHVASLSGYAATASGRRFAFSVLVNNFNTPASSIRPLIDRIALTVANQE